jgi:D-alanine--poly(phosphoribitol) ligase subunit 2
MEDLFKVLEKIKPGVDFKNNNSLIDDEILDSFDIVTLVAALDEEFDIQITAKDILPENFNSAEAMYKLIQRLEEE